LISFRTPLCHVRGIRATALVLFATVCTVDISLAQESSWEFWPETDIWCQLDSSWRASAFIPITRYNESHSRDLNIYVQADYKWGHANRTVYRRLMNENRAQHMNAWLVRGGVMEGWSLGERAGEYTEDMLYAEIHERIPIFEDVLLSHRIRTDFRWVGQAPQFSYRIRFRAMVEREFPVGSSSLVPYVNVEAYWDSRYLTFNRVRLIGGATVVWGPRFAYEGNITYQHDAEYATTNLYAVNIILHVFFE
jgi:hypothetical protein